VLSAIYEADFLGFRRLPTAPKRPSSAASPAYSADDAEGSLGTRRGHPQIFREHSPCRAFEVGIARIVDRRVLHLIRMWLDCPVEETDDRGRRTRTTEARDKRRGIPQGSPITP
jgi:hypothetical protein